MIAEAGADILIRNPTPRTLMWAEESLTFANPDYIDAERMGRWLGNIPPTLRMYGEGPGWLRVPYGCAKALSRLGEPIEWRPSLPDRPTAYARRPGWALRPYQEGAVEAMLRKGGGVLEAPCGSGKTQMGLALIEASGQRALWITHTKKLLKQSEDRAKALYALGKGDIGEITEGRARIGAKITFATVQTLSKCDPALYSGEFGIVVVDECHHAAGTPTRMGMFYKCLSAIRARLKYGLSATLTRRDGLIGCVYALLGEIGHTVPESAVGATVMKASIEMERLPEASREKLWATLGPDGMMDYQALLRTLTGDEGRQEAIARRVRALRLQGRRQLILTHRVAHAEALRDALLREGLGEEDVGICVGRVSEPKRDWGAPVIIATYALAKEGLDIPELDALHLTLPTKDESALTQACGRIERASPGKTQPVCHIWVDVGIPYCERACTQMRRILQRGGRKELKDGNQDDRRERAQAIRQEPKEQR